LPAAFIGIDIGKVLGGAAAMVERVTSDEVLDNPACLFAAGAYLALTDHNRTSLVMMPYSDALRTMAHWFVQLWAESLGKRMSRLGQEVYAGQTPIPAIGAPDQHSQLQLLLEGPRDKAVVLVGVEKHRHALPIPDELADREEVAFLHGRDLAEILQAERRATRAALLDAGVPVIDVAIPTVDEASFGGLLVLLEAACACTGIMMGINPFDQPGVEAGKRMALGLLGKAGYDEDVQRVLSREALAEEVP
jgi:glucose-6-phosphate isomerase